MKTINLRWIYPHYRHDEFVEVSDEVWEVMRQAQREMNNYERRKVYHRAWYSLDAYSWTENYALEHGRSPEEILLEREERAAHLRLLAALPEALSHEQRRHWDGREFAEYIVATEGVGIYGETPEDYLCRMETLGELMAVLDTCTEAQRRRFLLYALDGLSYAEIGTICGCSKYSVRDSIIAVRKIFKDFFENRPHE